MVGLHKRDWSHEDKPEPKRIKEINEAVAGYVVFEIY